MTDLALLIDGRLWSGWTAVEVTRSLERGAGAFRLELTERWLEPGTGRLVEPRPIVPGTKCEVRLDGDTVVTGYVDLVSVDYDAHHHRLTYQGRDKLADAIDSAAAVDGPFEWQDLDVREIAERLLGPFDIDVWLGVGVGPGDPFDTFAIQPGETAFEALERACRLRQLLPLANAAGEVVLARVGSQRAAGALVYGRNILQGSIERTFADRHSPVVVRGQGGTVDEVDVEGRVTDPAVGRHRPLLLLAEGKVDRATAAARARWQANVARGRALRVRYRVQGWRGPSGLLWAVNTLCEVDDPSLDLTGTLLVSGVTFRRAREGTTTELELTHPDAYAPEPPAPEAATLSGVVP